jgi:hypothetical protein
MSSILFFSDLTTIEKRQKGANLFGSYSLERDSQEREIEILYLMDVWLCIRPYLLMSGLVPKSTYAIECTRWMAPSASTTVAYRHISIHFDDRNGCDARFGVTESIRFYNENFNHRMILHFHFRANPTYVLRNDRFVVLDARKAKRFVWQKRRIFCFSLIGLVRYPTCVSWMNNYFVYWLKY